jgi:two-component system, NarL family, nitrate/nitrite response regulator NarL
VSQHHFLTSVIAQPPIAPSERWLLAFPEGQWSNWTRLQASTPVDDQIWVPTLHPDWLDKVAALVSAQSTRHVIVLSPVPYGAEGLRAINQGARGYCHLHAVPDLLREVAHVVQFGGLWVGPELVERMVAATRDLLGRAGPGAAPPAPDLSALSAREVQVAHAVAAGKSNKEVADQLFISERTVKAHLGSVFEKLGVRDRVQLVLRLSSSVSSNL